MMKFLYAVVFALLLMPTAAYADAVDVTVPECQTANGAQTCGTTLNATISPGSSAFAAYVSQDNGIWQLIACLGRHPLYSYSQGIPIGWIWRQHRHRFRYKAQLDCDPATPILGTRHATAFDPLLRFLAAIEPDAFDYAFVFREVNGVKEWLRFADVQDQKGTWFKTPAWSANTDYAQQFTRRAGETLAAMASNANSSPNPPTDYSTWYSGQVQPSCVIRLTLDYVWAYTYDKINDSWMWSGGWLPIHHDPMFKNLYVHCGDATMGDQGVADLIVRLLQNEAGAKVFGRNYGVREWRGDIARCGTPGYPSVCQQ